MRIEDLRPAPGSTKGRKRRGRGPGSGLGKTAGRGTKGLQARSGGGVNPGFEGGQMPLYRRLPKRGFLPHGGKDVFAIVNLGDIAARFAAGSVVEPDSLAAQGLIKKSGRSAVKVLGDGELSHAVAVRAHRISEGARQKVEAAGGTVEVIAVRPPTQSPAKSKGARP